MATIESIKTQNDTQIRGAVEAGSITPDIVSDLLDSILDEVRDRGIIAFIDDDAVQAGDPDDTKLAISLSTGKIYRHDGVSWVLVLNPGSGGPVLWNDITGKPSTFTPSAHSHVINDISDLQAALNAKQATLVSGANIKSINGLSLIGSGDLSIAAATKVTITFGADTLYNYNTGYLITRVIAIPSGNTAAFKIGTSPGGEDILEATPLVGTIPIVVPVNLYATTSGTIYFSGITSTTTIIIYYE